MDSPGNDEVLLMEQESGEYTHHSAEVADVSSRVPISSSSTYNQENSLDVAECSFSSAGPSTGLSMRSTLTVYTNSSQDDYSCSCTTCVSDTSDDWDDQSCITEESFLSIEDCSMFTERPSMSNVPSSSQHASDVGTNERGHEEGEYSFSSAGPSTGLSMHSTFTDNTNSCQSDCSCSLTTCTSNSSDDWEDQSCITKERFLSIEDSSMLTERPSMSNVPRSSQHASDVGTDELGQQERAASLSGANQCMSQFNTLSLSQDKYLGLYGTHNLQSKAVSPVRSVNWFTKCIKKINPFIRRSSRSIRRAEKLKKKLEKKSLREKLIDSSAEALDDLST